MIMLFIEINFYVNTQRNCLTQYKIDDREMLQTKYFARQLNHANNKLENNISKGHLFKLNFLKSMFDG